MLAGGLGAAWIGGPVAGVLVGLLGRRLQKSSLDAMAEDAALIEEANQGVRDNLEALRARATSPEDLLQLGTLETRLMASERMMAASSPRLQQTGEQLYASTLTAMTAYADKQEEQRIAADTRKAAAEQAFGAGQVQIFDSRYDDLYRESSDFISKRSAYSALLSAYAGDHDPGNIEDIAAINSVQRMIDPGVAVRDGDVALIQNYAGVPDWMVTALNRVAKEGGRFSPVERRYLVSLGDRLMRAANEEQTGTNSRFQEQASALGLRDELASQLHIPIVDVDAPKQLNYGPLESAQSRTAQPATEQAEPPSPSYTVSPFDVNRDGRIDNDEDPIMRALGALFDMMGEGRASRTQRQTERQRARGTIARPTND